MEAYKFSHLKIIFHNLVVLLWLIFCISQFNFTEEETVNVWHSHKIFVEIYLSAVPLLCTLCPFSQAQVCMENNMFPVNHFSRVCVCMYVYALPNIKHSHCLLMAIMFGPRLSTGKNKVSPT